MIENTSRRDPLVHLAGAFGGFDRYIEEQESAGQAQLVNSQLIPNKGSQELEALGFKLGPAVDDLFRQAELPAGWVKEGSDHSMWSYIVDQLGRRRVSIFYKAAFYDRSAFCSVNTVSGYVSSLLYDNAEPFLDDEWATAEAVIEAALGCIKSRQESLDLWTRPDVAAREGKYAKDRADETRAEIAKAEAFIEKVRPT